MYICIQVVVDLYVHVCMYTGGCGSMYMCICCIQVVVNLYVHVFIYTGGCGSMYMYLCLQVMMDLCTCIYVYRWLWIYMYIVADYFSKP